MNVMNVENVFMIVRPSLNIRGFIQGRNPINVMNVGRPSATKQLSPHIRKYTEEKHCKDGW